MRRPVAVGRRWPSPSRGCLSFSASEKLLIVTRSLFRTREFFVLLAGRLRWAGSCLYVFPHHFIVLLVKLYVDSSDPLRRKAYAPTQADVTRHWPSQSNPELTGETFLRRLGEILPNGINMKETNDKPKLRPKWPPVPTAAWQSMALNARHCLAKDEDLVALNTTALDSADGASADTASADQPSVTRARPVSPKPEKDRLGRWNGEPFRMPNVSTVHLLRILQLYRAFDRPDKVRALSELGRITIIHGVDDEAGLRCALGAIHSAALTDAPPGYTNTPNWRVRAELGRGAGPRDTKSRPLDWPDLLVDPSPIIAALLPGTRLPDLVLALARCGLGTGRSGSPIQRRAPCCPKADRGCPNRCL